MFSFCPKCETGKLNAAGTCQVCGYSLRTRCSSCGHLNIPGARFCGGCGQGMTVLVKLQNQINHNLSYLHRFRIRKFATGLAFGGLLTFFAFGSMGMQSHNEEEQFSHKYFAARTYDFKADFAVQFEKDLQKLCKNGGKEASSDDLNQVVNLLIQHLKPVARRLNRLRLPADSAAEYTSNLRNFSQSGIITRGSSAMVFFQFLSDFLEFNYRDFPQESCYNDIPRFHFMCVPVTALRNLGLELGRNQEDFGVTDPISLTELCNAARTIVANAEIRISRNTPESSAN